MGKRDRPSREEIQVEQSRPRAPDDNDWTTPELRRRVLIDLAFVAAPAIVMLALGERAIAAAWFGVGALIVVAGSHRQIRALWRFLRSDRK